MQSSSRFSATEECRSGPEGVVVPLGQLAAKALSAGQPRPDRLESLLQQTVRFYLGPGRGDAGWAYPKFLELEDDAAATLDIQLEPAAWQELSAEAERQGVAPSALLQHAALYFAAARDAGRLTTRILAQIDGAAPLRRGDDRRSA
jgi:hypothetical protein